MTSKTVAGVAAGLAVLTLGAGIASAQSDEDTDPTVTEQESTPDDTTVEDPTTTDDSTPDDESTPDDQSSGERPDGCDDAEPSDSGS